MLTFFIPMTVRYFLHYRSGIAKVPLILIVLTTGTSIHIPLGIQVKLQIHSE